MKKYKFLSICAFLVFLGVLCESLQKKKNIYRVPLVKAIQIDPKARFAKNGDILYINIKLDTLVISTDSKPGDAFVSAPLSKFNR